MDSVLANLSLEERIVYERLSTGQVTVRHSPVSGGSYQIVLAVAVVLAMHPPRFISHEERLLASITDEVLPSLEEVQQGRDTWFESYNEAMNWLTRNHPFRVRRDRKLVVEKRLRYWRENVSILAAKMKNL